MKCIEALLSFYTLLFGLGTTLLAYFNWPIFQAYAELFIRDIMMYALFFWKEYKHVCSMWMMPLVLGVTVMVSCIFCTFMEYKQKAKEHFKTFADTKDSVEYALKAAALVIASFTFLRFVYRLYDYLSRNIKKNGYEGKGSGEIARYFKKASMILGFASAAIEIARQLFRDGDMREVASVLQINKLFRFFVNEYEPVTVSNFQNRENNIPDGVKAKSGFDVPSTSSWDFGPTNVPKPPSDDDYFGHSSASRSPQSNFVWRDSTPTFEGHGKNEPKPGLGMEKTPCIAGYRCERCNMYCPIFMNRTHPSLKFENLKNKSLYCLCQNPKYNDTHEHCFCDSTEHELISDPVHFPKPNVENWEFKSFTEVFQSMKEKISILLDRKDSSVSRIDTFISLFGIKSLVFGIVVVAGMICAMILYFYPEKVINYLSRAGSIFGVDPREKLNELLGSSYEGNEFPYPCFEAKKRNRNLQANKPVHDGNETNMESWRDEEEQARREHLQMDKSEWRQEREDQRFRDDDARYDRNEQLARAREEQLNDIRTHEYVSMYNSPIQDYNTQWTNAWQQEIDSRTHVAAAWDEFESKVSKSRVEMLAEFEAKVILNRKKLSEFLKSEPEPSLEVDPEKKKSRRQRKHKKNEGSEQIAPSQGVTPKPQPVQAQKKAVDAAKVPQKTEAKEVKKPLPVPQKLESAVKCSATCKGAKKHESKPGTITFKCECKPPGFEAKQPGAFVNELADRAAGVHLSKYQLDVKDIDGEIIGTSFVINERGHMLLIFNNHFLEYDSPHVKVLDVVINLTKNNSFQFKETDLRCKFIDVKETGTKKFAIKATVFPDDYARKVYLFAKQGGKNLITVGSPPTKHRAVSGTFEHYKSDYHSLPAYCGSVISIDQATVSGIHYHTDGPGDGNNFMPFTATVLDWFKQLDTSC